MTDNVTIIHAADIHLDSPLRGLGAMASEDVVHHLRSASRAALANLVGLAVERGVDAVVLAGDTYDGDSEDYQTGREFIRAMDKLHAVGIPVVMIAGNHDAQSVITKTLTLPPNVVVLPTDQPGSEVIEDIGTAFHGQGFADRAVAHNLVTDYPKALPDYLNVGLLHTSLGGYRGHDPYAPCDIQELAALGYDYFALGHVHQREEFRRDTLVAAYAGNLQGRHIRETSPKGAYVVSLSPEREADLEFVELDVARWDVLRIDVSSATDLDGVLGMVQESVRRAKADAGSRVLVTRVSLVGAGEIAFRLPDERALREEILSIAERHGAVLEKVRNQTEPPAKGIRLGEPELEALRAAAGSLVASPSALRTSVQKIDAETAQILRGEVRLEDEGDADGLFQDQVQDALRELVARAEAAR